MKALLLVDIQNGFCPGGNLPVPEGDQVVPVANRLIDSGKYDLIVASQDWHPPGHGSFASSHPGKKPFEMGELSGKPQMMWPDHCVKNTLDAEFHPALKSEEIDLIQQKGENDICGLATDYCVKFSALDALAMMPGIKVRFIEDASRGITPEGVAAAIDEMRARGIEIIDSQKVLAG
jgi:nicotinamidase/pyrazinamidase